MKYKLRYEVHSTERGIVRTELKLSKHFCKSNSVTDGEEVRRKAPKPKNGSKI